MTAVCHNDSFAIRAHYLDPSRLDVTWAGLCLTSIHCAAPDERRIAVRGEVAAVDKDSTCGETEGHTELSNAPGRQVVTSRQLS